jgi:chromosome segregation ATPase
MPDAQDLPKLQADYKKLQDDIAALQEKAAVIQVQLRLTETQLAEIANATNGYDKSATDMQQELDADQKAIGKKGPTAEFKVKDLKGAIDKKIVEFDAVLEDQAKGWQPQPKLLRTQAPPPTGRSRYCKTSSRPSRPSRTNRRRSKERSRISKH